METAHLSTFGRVLRYGFPIVLMAAIPLFAWAVLILPAIAIQWHVEARDRMPLTVLYSIVVGGSLLMYLFALATSQ